MLPLQHKAESVLEQSVVPATVPEVPFLRTSQLLQFTILLAFQHLTPQFKGAAALSSQLL